MKRTKTLLPILCWMIGAHAFPQTLLSGKLVDAETKRPVANVFVQNRHHLEYSALSDENGSFSISVAPLDTIDLYRIGYEFIFLIYTKDKDIHPIELQPTEYDLPEITITNESAARLLEKAFMNVRKNYTKDTLLYLWHGILMEKKTNNKRESYAIYSIRSDEKKVRLNKKMSFEGRLLQLNHLVNVSDDSKVVKHSQYVTNIFPTLRISKNRDKYYRTIKTNSDNDSLIFIQGEPISNEKYQFKFEAIINQSDSVLLYYNYYLLNTIAEEDSIVEYDKARWLLFTFTYKSRNATGTLNIKKSHSGYYFSSTSSKDLISFLKDEKEEMIVLESTVQALPDKVPANSIDKNAKKLRGSTWQLFRTPATTTERFWEPSAPFLPL
jgi:hypothetical protein